MSISRDFSVATFVVWQNSVMLHKHKKLGRWLPCGGHIEANELPDDAAVREVLEESGVEIELFGEKALNIDFPRQLIRPRGIQLESISKNHEHIDLIYFGTPVIPYDGYLQPDDPSLGWYKPTDLNTLNVDKEIKAWIRLALDEIPRLNLK